MKSFLADFAEMMSAMFIGVILLYAFILPFWVLAMFTRSFDLVAEFVARIFVLVLDILPYVSQM